MARRRNNQVDWRRGGPIYLAIGVLFIFAIGLGIVVLSLAPHDEHVADGVRCLDNMRQLTTALMAYSLDNGRVLPPLAKPVRASDVNRAVIASGEDSTDRWMPSDWQHLLLEYGVTPSHFICPSSRSALSYDINSSPQGLAEVMVSDTSKYALIWDSGLHEKPKMGPHGGKYAVMTMTGVGMLTTGKDNLMQKMLFRP